MTLLERAFANLDSLIANLEKGVYPKLSPELQVLANKALKQVEKDKSATPEEVERWAEQMANSVSGLVD